MDGETETDRSARRTPWSFERVVMGDHVAGLGAGLHTQDCRAVRRDTANRLKIDRRQMHVVVPHTHTHIYGIINNKHGVMELQTGMKNADIL